MTVIETRQKRLLALISVMPMKARALAEMLGVRTQTVRNDISYLNSKGKLIISPSEYGLTVKAA